MRTHQAELLKFMIQNMILIPLQPKTGEKSSSTLLWSVAVLVVSDHDCTSEVLYTSNNHFFTSNYNDTTISKATSR